MAVAIRCRTFKEAQASSTVVVLAVSLLPLVNVFDLGGEAPWHLWAPALAQNTLMTRVLKGEALGLGQVADPAGGVRRADRGRGLVRRARAAPRGGEMSADGAQALAGARCDVAGAALALAPLRRAHRRASCSPSTWPASRSSRSSSSAPSSTPTASTKRAYHLAAWSPRQREPLAYARLLDAGREVRRAVDRPRDHDAPARAGRGLGRETGAARARACRATPGPGAAIRISAQSRLEAFYASLGFVAVGPALRRGRHRRTRRCSGRRPAAPGGASGG